MRSCGRIRAINRATRTHHGRPTPNQRSIPCFSSSNQVPVTEAESDGCPKDKCTTTQAKENAEARQQRVQDLSINVAGATYSRSSSSRLAASPQQELQNAAPNAGDIAQFQDLGSFIAAAASDLLGDTTSSRTSSQQNTTQGYSSQHVGSFIAAAASDLLGDTTSSSTSSQQNTTEGYSSPHVTYSGVADTHPGNLHMQQHATADAADFIPSNDIASQPTSAQQLQIAAIPQTVPSIRNDESTTTAASTIIKPTIQATSNQPSTVLDSISGKRSNEKPVLVASGTAAYGGSTVADSAAVTTSNGPVASSVADLSADDLSADHVSADDLSADHVSADDLSADNVSADDLSAVADEVQVPGAVSHKAAEPTVEALELRESPEVHESLVCSVSYSSPPQPFYTPPPRSVAQRQRRGRQQREAALPSLVVSVTSEEAFVKEVEEETERSVVLYISSKVLIQSGEAEEPEIHWKNDPVLLQMKRTAQQLVSVIDQCAREVKHVKFVHMQADIPEIRNLCNELEVPKLPSLQFWQKGALVFETCGVNNIQRGLSEGLLYYADTAARGAHVSPLVPDLHSAKDVKTFVSSHADQSLTVVGYFMTSLNACVHVFPAMYALAKAHPELSLARVLGDESDEMWQYCVQIDLVQAPTFVFYQMGEEVGRFVGGNKSDLIGQVLRYLVPSEHRQLQHLAGSAHAGKLANIGSTAPTVA